jgi:hypothetical protein
VALLRLTPEWERLWRRGRAIKVCEWKLTIEEQGLGQLEETEMFPECARIYKEHIPEHEW